MVRAEKYIFFEASSQISDMDEKYEVLLTGDSSGQVQLNIVKEFGSVPLFFGTGSAPARASAEECGVI